MRAREQRLRAESIDEERKRWKHLRAKRFGGFKFRRQQYTGSDLPGMADS
ncbi:MAG: DUF559 domain-containing protein [Deltaproteobacteria bacterium]|nr:DUF559 domain-containing protein [Deltaproteobacteria bacterium]